MNDEAKASRWFSPVWGEGWLTIDTKADSAGKIWAQFETMERDVTHIRFEVRGMCIGRPAYAARMARTSSSFPKIDDVDEFNWTTFTMPDGSMFAFRRHSAPPPAGTFIEAGRMTYESLTPKARRKYDADVAARKAAALPGLSLVKP